MNAVEPGTETKKLFFGNYEIVDTTGSGGMGVVYRAIDLQLGRPVALKILRDDLRSQQHIVARFQREAEAIATLNHPNIVHVYSVGSVGKIPYLAMEFIEGTTLGNLLAEHGPMPWQDALVIAAQIAEALASAHDCGIIHRDIKPGNILIEPSGKALVTDFGIAKVLNATTKLTVDGSRLGTPQYMSPERCKNKEITPASDIYSLGVLIYQCICGRLPYEAASPVELLAKITGEDPVRITEYMPEIPENIDRLLAHMLDPNPKARPQNARDLITLIERVRQGQPLEGRDTGHSKALQNFRVQLEKETPRVPSPKTEAQRASLRVRVARGWFQLSRGVRMVLAGLAMLLLAAALGIGGWQAARQLQPVASFRANSGEAAAWSEPMALSSVTQESQGVSLLHLELPGYVATRVSPIANSDRIAVEVQGAPGSALQGQYGLAEVSVDTPSAELVVAPAPLVNVSLMAAATGESGPVYVFAHQARAVLMGHGPTLPPNAAVAQPMGSTGRWAVARIQAGRWQVDVLAATGHAEFSVAVGSGPVTALAVSGDGALAALVTGTGENQTLWRLPLLDGATPVEVARGVITLQTQAFSGDGHHFVAVVKEKSEAAGEARAFATDGAAFVSMGDAQFAAYRPGSKQVLLSSADRTGRLQLWSTDGATPQQLTFLGTGIAGPFAAPSAGIAVAALNGPAGVALVSLP